MRAQIRVFKSAEFQGWCIFLVCIELLAFGFSHQFATRADFRSFYSAGAILRTSPGDLYNLSFQEQIQNSLVSPEPIVLPFYHPAFEAAIFAPFSKLSYRAAYLVWVAFIWILAGVAFLFAPFEKRLTTFLAFPPVFLGVLGGQDSILLLLIAVLTFRELLRGNVAWGGALLGLGVFRPQLAIPIALLLCVRYGWKFLGSFAGTGALCGAISVAMTGLEGFRDFCRLLFEASLAGNQASFSKRAMAVYPSSMPNLFGIVHLTGDRYLKAHSEFTLIMALSVIVFAFSAYCVWRLPSLQLSFTVGICCALLVSYHLYAHDLDLLLFPMALLGGRLHSMLSVACYGILFALCFAMSFDNVALMVPLVIGFLGIATARIWPAIKTESSADDAVLAL